MEAMAGYFVAVDMSEFGMHTKIWSTARQPVDEDNLYKFSHLAAQSWFDDRLLRIAKVPSVLLRFCPSTFLMLLCFLFLQFGMGFDHVGIHSIGIGCISDTCNV